MDLWSTKKNSCIVFTLVILVIVCIGLYNKSTKNLLLKAAVSLCRAINPSLVESWNYVRAKMAAMIAAAKTCRCLSDFNEEGWSSALT